MRRIFSKILAFCLIVFSYNAVAQDAQLKLIHNAADPAAAVVDIWVQAIGIPQPATRLLDDFRFGQATGFVTVPSGIPLKVIFAGRGSTSAADSIKTFNVSFAANQRYIVLAQGLAGTTGFAANPNGIPTALNLVVKQEARNRATDPNKVDLFVVHGATDAPGVDVFVREANATIVSNARYGDATQYLSVDPNDITIEVRPTGTTTAVASYRVPLSGFRGAALTVFASGFLAPGNNNGGPAFALRATGADSNVVSLPPAVASGAKVQVIHNCPDPAALEVDVWLKIGNAEPTKALDDFEYLTSTPFLDLPASTPIVVGIAPGSSNAWRDTLATFTYNLEAKNYILMATGVLNPNVVPAPIPGRNTAFNLSVIADARTTASAPNKRDVYIFHGSPNAPAVDIVINKQQPPAFRNVDFRGGSGAYAALDTGVYVVDIFVAGTQTRAASFLLDIDRRGLPLVVTAAGFLGVSNDGGDLPGFGLFNFRADGGEAFINDFTSDSTSVQVYHGSPDPAAAKVDIWLNGAKALPEFAYRAATPFIRLPANVPVNISVNLPGSTSPTDKRVREFNFPYLLGSIDYVLMASGVADPSGFSATAGRNIAFDLTIAAGRPSSTLPGFIQAGIVHLSPDAPVVDVVVNGGAVTVSELDFRDIRDYLDVPAALYRFDIRATGSSANAASFSFDASNYGGRAGFVVARGFLNPSANKSGPAFGLDWLDGNGELIEIPAIPQSVNEFTTGQAGNILVQPNPVSTESSVRITAKRDGFHALRITDAFGTEVFNAPVGQMTAGEEVTIAIDANNFSSGAYFVQVNDGVGQRTIPMTVVK